jgi:MAF protein
MLILASNSPRRKQLISLFNIPFQVIAADIDESIEADEKPRNYVSRLARSKCQSTVPQTSHRQIIVAADTAVVDGDAILGKPTNASEAIAMLRALRDRSHHVYTSISLRDTANGRVFSDICITEVLMRPYSEAEIMDYVASGDPFDKAGAYAIQNQGFDPVEKVTGCYTNVVGLPLCHLAESLRTLKLDIPEDITLGCRSTADYDCRLINQVLENSQD